MKEVSASNSHKTSKITITVTDDCFAKIKIANWKGGKPLTVCMDIDVIVNSICGEIEEYREESTNLPCYVGSEEGYFTLDKYKIEIWVDGDKTILDADFFEKSFHEFAENYRSNAAILKERSQKFLRDLYADGLSRDLADDEMASLIRYAKIIRYTIHNLSVIGVDLLKRKKA